LRSKLEELRDSARTLEVPSKEVIRDTEEAVRDAMLNGTPVSERLSCAEIAS